jgi:hypothetical protein
VVHACNPSHLGGRDQEGGVRSHPGQIVPETLSRKNPSQKRVSGVAQGVGRESKPKYWRGKKKKKGRMQARAPANPNSGHIALAYT